MICEKTLETELDTGSFRSLIVLDGIGTLTAGGKTIELAKGDSIFIPAQKGRAVLKGRLHGILSRV